MARTSQPKRAQKAKQISRAHRTRRDDTPSESSSSEDEYQPSAHEDQDNTDDDAPADNRKQVTPSRKGKGKAKGPCKKNPVSLVNPYDYMPMLPVYGRYGGMIRYRAAALWCKINIGRLRTWRHIRVSKPFEKAICVACGGDIRTTESELRRHGYAHLHEHLRPFPCPFEGCHRRFAQRRQRETHFLIHFDKIPLEDRTYCGIIHEEDGTTCLWWDKDPSRVSTHRKEGHPGEERPTLEEIRANERVRVAYMQVTPRKNLAREQDGELWTEPWDGDLHDGWGLRACGAEDDTGLTGRAAPDALDLMTTEADMQPDPMLDEMLQRAAYLASSFEQHAGAAKPAEAPAAGSATSSSAASSAPTDWYDSSMDSSPSTSVEPEEPSTSRLPPPEKLQRPGRPNAMPQPPIFDMSSMYEPPAASSAVSNAHPAAPPAAVAPNDARPTVPLRRSARNAKSREATTAPAPATAPGPSKTRSRRGHTTRPKPYDRAPSPAPEPSSSHLDARAPTPAAPSAPTTAPTEHFVGGAPVGTFGAAPIGGSFALRIPADWRLRTSDGRYVGETWRGASEPAGARGGWPERMPAYRVSSVRDELPAPEPPMRSLYDDYPRYHAPPLPPLPPQQQEMFPFGYRYPPQDARDSFRLVPVDWSRPAGRWQSAPGPWARRMPTDEEVGVEALLSLREERVHAPAPAPAPMTPFDTLQMVAAQELRRLNAGL